MLMMHDDGKIKIALSLCDPNGTYARHAAVVMASIFANTKSLVCVYLLHDDTLTEENKEKLIATAKTFSQEAVLINVQDRMSECVPIEKINSPGRATYFRLLIPSLFQFPKIIYLDCDIIVNMDVKDLWDIPVRDCALAAVLDSYAYAELKGIKNYVRERLVYQRIGIKKEKYFNAGVLLMNLEKINARYLFSIAVAAFFERYGAIIPFADQDFLNYLFADDCLFIDDKFCRMDFAGTETGDVDGYILHLICDNKPWSSYTRPYVDNLYWEYLAMTPYCGDNKTLIKTLFDDICTKEFYHLRTSDCKKHYKKRLSHNLRKGHLIPLPAMLWNIFKVSRKNDGVAQGAKEFLK